MWVLEAEEREIEVKFVVFSERKNTVFFFFGLERESVSVCVCSKMCFCVESDW